MKSSYKIPLKPLASLEENVGHQNPEELHRQSIYSLRVEPFLFPFVCNMPIAFKRITGWLSTS